MIFNSDKAYKDFFYHYIMETRIIAIFLLSIILISSLSFAEVTYMEGTDHIEVRLLNQQPDPVEPGKYVEVRFNVINTGLENAENVLFEIEPKFPFSLEKGVDAQKNLGTILGGATGTNGVTVYYRLYVDKAANQGTTDIKVKYKVDNNLWATRTFQIRIRSNQSLLAIEQIITKPQQITPGSVCSIFMTLKNNGDDDIKNVIVKLIPITIIPQTTGTTYIESDFSPYEDSTEKIIKNIETGKSETVEFKLIASSDSQLKPYKIPIQIAYEDRMGHSYSKEIYAGLVVREDIDYVAVAEKEDQIIENSKNKIYVTISNKGKSKMNFVYIEILPSEDYTILGTAGTYLGNLDSDDEDSAEYELFFPKYNKTKEVMINTRISYRDAYNKKYTEKKHLPILIYTAEDILMYEQKSKGSNTVLYISVLVLILAGYWYLKRRKKKKEEEQEL